MAARDYAKYTHAIAIKFQHVQSANAQLSYFDDAAIFSGKVYFRNL